MVEDARSKVAALPGDSPTRRVATSEWFDKLAEIDPPAGYAAPPLLLHLKRSTQQQLMEFDNDIKTVNSLSGPTSKRQDVLEFGKEVISDPKACDDDMRQWCAGYFELGIQAMLIRGLGRDRVEVSPELPSGKSTTRSGKSSDARITLESGHLWIEIAILSDSDNRLEYVDWTADAQSFFVSTEYDSCRLFNRVLKKVCGEGPEHRGQLHPSEPSLLVIGDCSFMPPWSDLHSLEVVLHKLTGSRLPLDTTADINGPLGKYISRRLAEPAIAQAFQKLSGIAILTSSFELRYFNTSFLADESHRLTEVAVKEVARLLSSPPSWAAST